MFSDSHKTRKKGGLGFGWTEVVWKKESSKRRLWTLDSVFSI